MSSTSNRIGVVSQPAPQRYVPSPEYIQTLRDIGASQETIDLALGLKPRRWWQRKP